MGFTIHGRCGRALVLMLLLACCVCLIQASAAFAGGDDWGCLSTLGTFCSSPYRHHEAQVFALYTGGGSLPLLAGSYCEEAACAPTTWLFSSKTGGNGNGYNKVLACHEYTYCVNGTTYLGNGKVENLHESRHNISGDDLW